MSDAPAKKRPWFQLHLSTCVVIMMVTGAICYKNWYTGTVIGGEMVIETYPPQHFPNSGRVIGWPVHMGNWYEQDEFPGKGPRLDEIGFTELAINCLVAISILVLTAVCCEALNRRRERRRGAS